MDDRRKIAIAVILAILATVAIRFGYRSAEAPPAKMSPTKSKVPAGTVVPEPDSAGVPGNVALPDVVTAAAPQSGSKFRSFNLRVEGDKFIPDTLAVRVGDTVHVNITAADKDYDFVQPDYGLNGVLPAGQTKILEFQAITEGKYTLYCGKCGGPENGPVGYIIVVGE